MKKGQFSTIEERTLRAAITQYCTVSWPIVPRDQCFTSCQSHNLNESELVDILFTKNRKEGEHSGFWSEISTSTPAGILLAC